MNNANLREWLADVKERSEADQSCYRCRLAKREHRAGYAASRCTFTTSPAPDSYKAAMAAALIAVLDLCDESAPIWFTADQAYTHASLMDRVHDTIIDHLKGNK